MSCVGRRYIRRPKQFREKGAKAAARKAEEEKIKQSASEVEALVDGVFSHDPSKGFKAAQMLRQWSEERHLPAWKKVLGGNDKRIRLEAAEGFAEVAEQSPAITAGHAMALLGERLKAEPEELVAKKLAESLATLSRHYARKVGKRDMLDQIMHAERLFERAPHEVRNLVVYLVFAGKLRPYPVSPKIRNLVTDCRGPGAFKEFMARFL